MGTNRRRRQLRYNFLPALSNLREFEGFASNDPLDDGGETVHGISRVFHPYMWVDGVPPTWEQAEAFYLRLWIASGCDELPFPVDVVHFDSCVNPGPGAAKQFLMWSGEHADPMRRTTEYLICRQEYYLERVRKRPANLEYICGWMARTIKMWRRTVNNSWDAEYL